MIGYVIAIVISCVLLFIFGRNVMHGLRSRNWPTAEGRITQSSIETHMSTDDEGDTRTTYGASIHYTYNVAGEEFEGTRRTFTDARTSSMQRAQNIIARYPQGSPVTVYYSEEDPSLSVLEVGVSWFSYVLIVLLLGLLVVGILGVAGVIG
jgi:hypothetical protein